MCTLAVGFQLAGPYPLVVAANRDEALDRPARAPFLWPQGFIAPRDEQALGTWLGLNPQGLFVGITNRFAGPREQGRTSRGALVVQALQARSAAELHERLHGLKAGEYNGFHLIYSDGREAFVSWGDGERLHQLQLQPGVHVVTERSFGPDEPARGELVRSGWPTPPGPDRLMALLRLKGVASPLDGTFVFAPEFNYGTRSSLVLLRHQQLAQSRWFWAEGPPPDPPPFAEQRELVEQLTTARSAP